MGAGLHDGMLQWLHHQLTACSPVLLALAARNAGAGAPPGVPVELVRPLQRRRRQATEEAVVEGQDECAGAVRGGGGVSLNEQLRDPPDSTECVGIAACALTPLHQGTCLGPGEGGGDAQ